jgi:hypothetical protein
MGDPPQRSGGATSMTSTTHRVGALTSQVMLSALAMLGATRDPVDGASHLGPELKDSYPRAEDANSSSLHASGAPP